jgi:hypothetical protein
MRAIWSHYACSLPFPSLPYPSLRMHARIKNMRASSHQHHQKLKEKDSRPRTHDAPSVRQFHASSGNGLPRATGRPQSDGRRKSDAHHASFCGADIANGSASRCFCVNSPMFAQVFALWCCAGASRFMDVGSVGFFPLPRRLTTFARRPSLLLALSATTVFTP